MIEVLVRAMVERFESKGEIFLWNRGNKSKRVSVVWYIAKTMNTQTEFEVQEYTSMASHRWSSSGTLGVHELQ